jgi:signal peptidase II
LSPKSRIITLIAVSVYLLDRLTKLAVVEKIQLFDSVTVVKGFFDLTNVQNTGAAFSLFAQADDGFRVPLLVASSVAAILLLLYFLRKVDPRETLVIVALAMILGGALGNLTDRLLYGYVIDFINWHIGEHYWPAFNIADSGITVGVCILGIEIVLRKKSI